MFKKIISSLIVVSLTVVSLTLPEPILKQNKVSAETAFEDSVIKTMDYKVTTDGKYIYNILDDGNVEIVRYTGKGYNIKLPSEIDGKTVTTIGSMNTDAAGDLGGGITDGSVVGAFQECNIQTIELPDTITKIDYIAFAYCKGLSEIKFSNNLQEIGDYAFYGCEGLEEITFPQSLKKIDYRAFGSCKKLKTVTIPKSVQNLDSSSLGYMITLYYPFDSNKIDGFSINCYKGTAGEQYAIDNGFDYVLLDDEEVVTLEQIDINNDGTISTADVGLINAHAKGTKQLSGEALTKADINKDGKVSTADVGIINAYAKGTKKYS